MALPEELTLQPSRLKWFGFFLIGALGTAGGIWLIGKEGGVMPWVCTLFSGMVAGASLVQWLSSSYLHLHAEGFEQNMMRRKMEYRWDEVSDFHVWTTRGNSFVGFNRIQDQGEAMGKVKQMLSGRSASLGDTFGMSAEALADLMNAFREGAQADRSTDG